MPRKNEFRIKPEYFKAQYNGSLGKFRATLIQSIVTRGFYWNVEKHIANHSYEYICTFDSWKDVVEFFNLPVKGNVDA